jgi:ATP-dependent DNA helicase RecG
MSQTLKELRQIASHVALFHDYLEITNPGALHFGITPEKLTQPHESKPWNPIIANVFCRAGIIERWGSGTLNIIDWCDENGNPPPTWSEQAGSVFVTFTPAFGEATPQVTPQIMQVLQGIQGEMTRGELMAKLELKDRMHFSQAYLQPALEEGVIEMTIPDKPKSRLQKYRLTSKGREMLRGLKVQGLKFED